MRTLDHVQKGCRDGDDDDGLDVHVFGTSLDGFETKPDCLSKYSRTEERTRLLVWFSVVCTTPIDGFSRI